MGLHFVYISMIALAVGYSSSCGKSPTDQTSAKTEPSYRVVDSVTKMKATTVHLRILTSIKIECGEFDNQFPEAKETGITRTSERDSVLIMLAETKSLGKTFSGTPDARGVLAISYTNGMTEAFCFNDQLIRLGDSTYYLSPAFKAYLWKISDTTMPPK